MDWIRDNKFLAGYIAVFVVVGGLLGYLLFSARTAYKNTIADYNSTAQLVEGLSSKDLYPDKETLELVQQEAGKFRAAVDKLQGDLLEFNRPLNVSMTGGGFQQKLTQLVVALKKRSVLEGVDLEDEFSLGLNRYTAELPNEKAVPDLDFHLDALNYLANALFDAQVDSIDVFERIPLAIEGGASEQSSGDDDTGKADDQAKEYVHRYPVRICLKGRPETLETFINRISNAPKEEFFFNTRYITIENETDEGPQKGIEFEVGIRSSEGLETESDDEQSGLGDGEEAEGGVVDSRVVLGNEKIEACMVIEAIRIDPIPVPDAEAEGDAE